MYIVKVYQDILGPVSGGRCVDCAVCGKGISVLGIQMNAASERFERGINRQASPTSCLFETASLEVGRMSIMLS